MELEDYYTKEELLEWQYFKEGAVVEEPIGKFIVCWRLGGEKSYEFIVGEWCASDGIDRYQRKAQGWVAFDGCRHLWFCYQKESDFNGYDNYASFKSYELLFKRLREINNQLGIEE